MADDNELIEALLDEFCLRKSDDNGQPVYVDIDEWDIIAKCARLIFDLRAQLRISDAAAQGRLFDG